MNRSIIILGGAGFIGSHFIEKCLQNGDNIYCIDNLSYASDESFLEKHFEEFEFHKKDISQLDYIPGADIIINFAAESHVDNSIANSEKFLDSNIKGAVRILDLIKQKSNYKMPLYIHISTDEVYGDNKTDKSFTEEQILNPSNPYAASKASADMMILSYARTHNIPFVIFRPTNQYGIRQHPEKFIPKSIQLLMRNEKIQIHGDGSFERCWLHVEDTCDAIYKFIDGYSEINNINQIYNISGNEFLTIKNIAEYIIYQYKFNALLGDEWPIEFNDYITYNYIRKGADINYRINDTKLRNLIKWEPKRQFFKEIKNIVDYTRNNYRW
jgi:dTDP-glucose 4,6-dehydratase